jgi:hypothetical protein
MRIAVLTQLAKGLRCPPERSTNAAQELQRVKWFLWHGNVFRARLCRGAQCGRGCVGEGADR